LQGFTIPSCCGVGLPAGCIATSPVSSYLTFSPLPVLKAIGCFVSVALSLVLRRQSVRLTPALLQPGLSSA